MPDPFVLPTEIAGQIQGRLAFLYRDELAPSLLDELTRHLAAFEPALSPPERERFSQQDAILITYGDSVRRQDQPPLQTLHEIAKRYLTGVTNSIHILPFFPYSSDDGFSVIDYTAVNPLLGSWDDIEWLREDFRLMFDAVINHISVESKWFKRFLAGQSPYTDYFITVRPGLDLSMVTRPRALPLLHPFETAEGTKHVWTTFSADQADLNYATPDVLLAITDVLLTYIQRGAHYIRLDAIAYLWKELGTSCIHLPQTHEVVKLFRSVLDAVAPWVILITETNVPHEENISYFGEGDDEAQMVYNFSLPPLTLHAVMTGDATTLSRWAGTLAPPSDQTTFFNFTASHDGIGVRPVEDILDEDDFNALVARVKAHGGRVSYKTNPDGSETPYELNINYFDALSDPNGTEPLERQARRFLLSQAIMLAMPGVPGIYLHSLFGSRSDYEGMERLGYPRAINREKLDADALIAELENPGSLRAQVYWPYTQMLHARSAARAFHPNGAHRVLDLDPAVFALLRTPPGEHDRAAWVMALHNVSDKTALLSIDIDTLTDQTSALRGLLSGETYPVESGRLRLSLAPYEVNWLTPITSG